MSPPRLSNDERRHAIMLAAIPLFADKGYDALTTKEIADAAGISEALLYRHFESKQVLFNAVQDTCVTHAAAEVRRLESLPDNTSTLVMAVYLLAAKVQGFMDRPGEHPGEDRHFARLMLRSLLSDGEFARGFLAETSAAWVRKIERCVAAAIAAGDLEETVEGGCVGVWFVHHLSVALNFFRLPGGAPVIQYPVDQADLFEHSVMYGLRGMGLTREAIAKYYNPKAFALMSGHRSS